MMMNTQYYHKDANRFHRTRTTGSTTGSSCRRVNVSFLYTITVLAFYLQQILLSSVPISDRRSMMIIIPFTNSFSFQLQKLIPRQAQRQNQPIACTFIQGGQRGFLRQRAVLLFQSSVGVDVSNTNSGSGSGSIGSTGSSSTNNDTSTMLPAAIEYNDNSRTKMPHQQQLRASEISNDKAVKLDAALAIETTTVENSKTAMISDDELLRKNVFNALLLGLTFGYAAYTIFNIDHGMTRGWTQSEIAMRIPLDNWLNYESSLTDRPIATKTAINVIIYLLGDWLSQTAFSGNDILNFNAARTIRNGFIGLCFGPLVHEYYQFSDHILPVDGGMFIRLQKIIMDQTIYLSVKCSIYIAAVGLLQGDDINSVKQNVQTKLPSIVLTAWKFWPLVHLVTYGVIPARHRILWVNCVDLIWNAILATMSQKKDGTDGSTNDDAVVEGDSSTILLQQPLPPPLVFEATISDNSSMTRTVFESTTSSVDIQAIDNSTITTTAH